VRFRPDPGIDGVRSLRAMLKIALRQLGLRALNVTEQQKEKVMSSYSDKIEREKQKGLYRVSDFDGNKEVTHTIDCLHEDVLMFERKMDLLCFRDTLKQLQVNVTNGEALIKLFGAEPDDWAGKQVTLHRVEYQEGKFGIRVKVPGKGNSPLPPAVKPKLNFDDEIPF
jgi:hypothetical protein